MSKYKNRNTKLNSLVMNNVRIRKSVISTLCRCGLICLLFLAPWVSNLQAQPPYYGQVGIDTSNDRAVLKILDDDNLNSNSTAEGIDSRKRRTIIVDKVSDGIEGTTPGSSAGSTNIRFKVRFYNDGNAPEGYPDKTTAVSDVWAFFKINDGSAKGDASYAEGVDFTFPTATTDLIKVADRIYKVKIPEGENESDVITLNVFGDNIIEGLENLHIELLNSGSYVPYADPEILSEDDTTPTEFPVVATPYEFTITDKTGDNPANKIIIVTADDMGIDEGGSTVIRVKLPYGITSSVEVPVTLIVTGGNGASRLGDYMLNGTPNAVNPWSNYPVTIPANQSEATFTLSADSDDVLYDNGAVEFKIAGVPTTYGGINNNVSVNINDKTKDNPDNLKLKVVASKSPIDGDGSDVSNISVCFVNSNVTTATDIVVNLSQASGTAVLPDNYTWLGTQVTIPGNSISSCSNSVQVRGENAHVLGGSWDLVIKGEAMGYTDIANATVMIVDKNHLVQNNLDVRFDPTADDVLEGNDVNVVIKLKDGFTTFTELQIPIRIDGNSCTADLGTDYTVSNPTITTEDTPAMAIIPPGGDRAIIKLTARTDTDTEPDEYVHFIKAGTIIGSVGYTHDWETGKDRAIFTIKDVTGPSAKNVVVELDKDNLLRSTSATGDKVKITAKLGGTFSVPVKVSLTLNGASTIGGDYTLTNPYVLTIPAYQTEASVEVWAPCNYTVTDVRTIVLNAAVDTDPSNAIAGLTVSFKDNVNTIKVQPVGIDNGISGLGVICANEELELTAQAAPGGRTFTYKWYKGGTLIGGANTNKLVIPVNSLTAGNYEYKVVVTAEYGCEREFSHQFTVNRLPEPVSISSNSPSEVCGTPKVTITASTDEDDPVTYRWYRIKDGESIVDGPLQTGPSNVYEIVDGVSGKYWVEMSLNATSCAIESSIRLPFKFGSGYTPATPKIAPSPASFCAGGSAVLTVTKADGTEYPATAEYHWYKNNASYVVIPDGGNTLSVSDPDTYSVIVYVGGCPSSEVFVTVSQTGGPAPDQPIVDPATQAEFCKNGSVTLSVVNFVGGLSYQWYYNHANDNTGGIAIADGISASIAADTEGWYYVIASDGTCHSLVSTPVHVTESATEVNIDKPVLNYTNSAIYCDGGSVTLSVINLPEDTYPNVIFQWHDLNGAINVNGTGRSLHVSTNGTYWVVASDGSGCQTKASEKIVVSKSGSLAPVQPKITAKNDVTSICAVDGSIELKAVKNNNQPYVSADNITKYEWYQDGNLIATTVSNVYHALGSDIGAGNTATYVVKVYSGGCESLPSAGLPISVG
ncbi:MAG: hypothetical protein LBG19_07180, partial [Prevotellaceae bacterium]|nr:hypothetical protein [Prevotellaceae bacterium]